MLAQSCAVGERFGDFFFAAGLAAAFGAAGFLAAGFLAVAFTGEVFFVSVLVGFLTVERGAMGWTPINVSPYYGAKRHFFQAFFVNGSRFGDDAEW